MLMIPRKLEDILHSEVQSSNKAIILYGPRQVGKTTLVKSLLSKLPYRTLEINADEERFIDVLSSRNSRKLGELVAGYELLFLDEAQRIPDIGINLKILIDTFPELKIIATGSSSLELATGVSEPLTGRKCTFHLFPISQLELNSLYNSFELNQLIEERLIWGSYPDIFNLSGRERKERYLVELSGDYLYRDVLKLADVRSPDKIRSLLKLLAFQIGNEVSLNELSNSLGIGKETVARYIDLLEKCFVLRRQTGFSRNLRKEVSKSRKFYFYDLGVRNAIINNFNTLENRNDIGALWENFLVIERLKLNSYSAWSGNTYFWRTYTGAGIDYVEESQGKLRGYEIKFSSKKPREPTRFLSEYQNSTWQVISRENWLDFILKR